MIQVGDRLPNGIVSEFIDTEREGCSLGPNHFKVEDLVKGKRIIIFGLPGAYTPTCSAKHVPGYVQNHQALKAKGIDEIWCFAVNDAFVMGAWGRDQQVGDKVRMMADGSGRYTRALGLELDLSEKNLGMRCQRFAMLVEDGVVKSLFVEPAGQFGVSSAEHMLEQLSA